MPAVVTGIVLLAYAVTDLVIAPPPGGWRKIIEAWRARRSRGEWYEYTIETRFWFFGTPTLVVVGLTLTVIGLVARS